MRTRLAAIDSLDADVSEANYHAATLNKRLARAEASGDPLSQAVLQNALGVLASRKGDHADAQYHFTEAILLSLATSDLFTLGGALFNFALSHIRQGLSAQHVDHGDLVEDILQLCVYMDDRLGIGRNSAQAEILLLRLLVSEGRRSEAEEMLRVADAMVAKSGNAYDAACLLVARARFTWMKAMQDGSTKAAKPRVEALLERAIEHFGVSGRLARAAEADLKQLRAGRGVSLSFYGEHGSRRREIQ